LDTPNTLPYQGIHFFLYLRLTRCRKTHGQRTKPLKSYIGLRIGPTTSHPDSATARQSCILHILGKYSPCRTTDTISRQSRPISCHRRGHRILLMSAPASSQYKDHAQGCLRAVCGCQASSENRRSERRSRLPRIQRLRNTNAATSDFIRRGRKTDNTEVWPKKVTNRVVRTLAVNGNFRMPDMSRPPLPDRFPSSPRPSEFPEKDRWRISQFTAVQQLQTVTPGLTKEIAENLINTYGSEIKACKFHT